LEKGFCVESNCDNYINGECVVDSEYCPRAKEAEAKEYLYECEVTCPLCGALQKDLWESSGGEGDFDHWCDGCGKTLRLNRNISITYDIKVLPEEVVAAEQIEKGEG
jgi:hypothetical protein